MGSAAYDPSLILLPPPRYWDHRCIYRAQFVWRGIKLSSLHAEAGTLPSDTQAFRVSCVCAQAHACVYTHGYVEAGVTKPLVFSSVDFYLTF